MICVADSKVEEIMQVDIVTINPNDTLSYASKLMEEEEVGTVLVVNEDFKLLGLVTDRQIVLRALAHGLNPKTTKIREIMTTWPMTVPPDTTCREALNIISDFNFRRLPVEKDGQVVGIVSLSDLVSKVEIDDDFIWSIIDELSRDVRCK